MGINQTWKSDWSNINTSSDSLDILKFNDKYSHSLHQDFLIRDYLDILYSGICRYSIIKKKNSKYLVWNQQGFNFLKVSLKKNKRKINSLKTYNSLVKDYKFYHNKLNMKLIVSLLRHVYECRLRIKIIDKLINFLVSDSTDHNSNKDCLLSLSSPNRKIVLLNQLSHSLKKSYWIKYTSDFNYLKYQKNKYFLKNKSIYLYNLKSSDSNYLNFLIFKSLKLNTFKLLGYSLSKLDFKTNSRRWKLYNNFYWNIIFKNLVNSFYLKKDNAKVFNNLFNSSFDFLSFKRLNKDFNFEIIKKIESNLYSSSNRRISKMNLCKFSPFSLFVSKFKKKKEKKKEKKKGISIRKKTKKKGKKRSSNSYSQEKLFSVRAKSKLLFKKKLLKLKLNKFLVLPKPNFVNYYFSEGIKKFKKERRINLNLKNSFLLDSLFIYRNYKQFNFIFKLYKTIYSKNSTSRNFFFYRDQFDDYLLFLYKKKRGSAFFERSTFLENHVKKSFTWANNIYNGNSSYYDTLSNESKGFSLEDGYKGFLHINLFLFLLNKDGIERNCFFNNVGKKKLRESLLLNKDYSSKDLSNFNNYFIYFIKKKIYNNIDFQKYLNKNIKFLNSNRYSFKKRRRRKKNRRKRIGFFLLRKFKRFVIKKKQKSFKFDFSYLSNKSKKFKYQTKVLSKRRYKQLESLANYLFKKKKKSNLFKLNSKFMKSRLASVNLKTSSHKNLVEVNIQLESHKYKSNLNFHKEQNRLRKIRSRFEMVRYLKKLTNIKSRFNKKNKSFKKRKKNLKFNRQKYNFLSHSKKIMKNARLYSIIPLKRNGSYSRYRRLNSFLVWYKDFNKNLYRRDSFFSSNMPMAILSSSVLSNKGVPYLKRCKPFNRNILPLTFKTKTKDSDVMDFLLKYSRMQIFSKGRKFKKLRRVKPLIRTNLIFKRQKKVLKLENSFGLFLNKENKHLRKKDHFNKFLSLSQAKVRSKHLIDLSKFNYFNSFLNFFSKFDSKSSVKGSRLQLSVKHYDSRVHNSYVMVENISKFLIAYSKRGRGGRNKFNQIRNTSYRILTRIRDSDRKRYKGLGFGFSGRAYGAKKAANFKVFVGSVPLSTFRKPIDYSCIHQCTKNGTWGFHSWLNVSQYKRKTLQSRPSLFYLDKNNERKRQSSSKRHKKSWKKYLTINQ